MWRVPDFVDGERWLLWDVLLLLRGPNRMLVVVSPGGRATLPGKQGLDGRDASEHGTALVQNSNDIEPPGGDGNA